MKHQIKLNGAAGRILRASDSFLFWHRRAEPADQPSLSFNLDLLIQAAQEYKRLIESPVIKKSSKGDQT